jgi:hypothetical protein
MAARYVTVDRETALLLAPDLRDWVPSNHLVHLIIDAVGELDLRQARVAVACALDYTESLCTMSRCPPRPFHSKSTPTNV